jgi:ABC-type antimicrobial peptide transport system permease subunit
MDVIPQSLTTRVLRSGTLAGALNHELAPNRAQTFIWLLYAAAGLSSALVGVAVLISSIVRERRFEAAVRAACGATPSAIALFFCREGIACVAAGAASGALVAALIVRVAASTLWGLESLTAELMLAGVLTVFVTGCVAAILPAIRMARSSTSLLRLPTG